MQNSNPNDSQTNLLVEEAQKGNIQAFEKIIKSHQSYAFAIALRFLCNEEDAEDVVQESFIRIWNHLHNFEMGMKFTTWMYRIVVNLCYDKVKSNKRRMNVFTRLNTESMGDRGDNKIDLEQELSNKEIAAQIRSLADGLSEKQRMIFLLRDMQDLSIAEVMDITGMSESAIKTNLYFARQQIRRKIAALEVNI
jgi:RNA polymerase sigma-70 factor (ECF subfamily)